MNSLQLNTPNQYKDKGISFSFDNLIILNFAVLVFFTFFGTKLPFQGLDFEETVCRPTGFHLIYHRYAAVFYKAGTDKPRLLRSSLFNRVRRAYTPSHSC